MVCSLEHISDPVMRHKRVVGPIAWIQVAIHEDLAELKKRQSDLSSKSPLRLQAEDRSQLVEIALRPVVLIPSRKVDAPLLFQLLLKRVIESDVFVGIFN